MGLVNFKINSGPLFAIFFKLKNDNFKTRDFSPLILEKLAGVPCNHWILRDQMLFQKYFELIVLKLYLESIEV